MLFKDSGRLKLHEDLEAETIKASIHRHKIATFAAEIEAEIRGKFALLSCIMSRLFDFLDTPFSI